VTTIHFASSTTHAKRYEQLTNTKLRIHLSTSRINGNSKNIKYKHVLLCTYIITLAAEHIGQGGQSPAQFLCQWASTVDGFSASKSILLPFLIEYFYAMNANITMSFLKLCQIAYFHK